MEEESLLKERLQVITDKRRIREDVRHKRRDIEEEKLKLQYIKKKSLREQWLMEGLQSEEEQETMKLQAQDELQRTTQLQSNILRMEKEIEELEAEELNISAKEEEILRRLKEVERTTEDIIKELSLDPLSEVSWPSPLPEDSLSDIFMDPAPPPTSAQDQEPLEPKRATFAMEISVELNKRTGKTQVISAATVTPDVIQGKGLKVYEDGRKSVYALPPGGGVAEEVSEMTPTDVEELLRQATDWSGDVQYHQPVYSAPYTGTSRPSTPRTASRTTSPHTSRTPNLSHSRAGSRLEVYPELEEGNACDSIQTTNNTSDSPYAILGSESVTTPAQPVKTSPPQATHRYEMDVCTKPMKRNQLSTSDIISVTDKFTKSETPSPALSCSESGIEELQEDIELDVNETKNPWNNQTLYFIDDFSNLASEEISSPTQSPFEIKECNSLRVTHRYELDLIEKSMHRCTTSPVETEKDHFSESKTPSPAVSHREAIIFRSKTAPTKSVNNAERPPIDIQSAQRNQKAALVSVTARSDGIPTPTQPLYTNIETSPPFPQGCEINLDRNSPSFTESTINSLLEELAPGAVTMIFMGYEKVDEDEGDDIQAEVVVIGENEEEEEDLTAEENLSMIYHPNGCTSQVYQPVVGVAKVMEGGAYGEGPRWRGALPHKPTFRHQAGKSTNCPPQGPDTFLLGFPS